MAQLSRSKQLRKSAQQLFFKLPYLDRRALRKAANILGVPTTRLMKGAIAARLTLEGLRFEIRSCIARGTFPDRIERLVDFLQACEVHSDPVQEHQKPEQEILELIDAISDLAKNLPDQILLDLVLGWAENPQGEFEDH